jgi:type I restriction enzyme S subunit
VAENEMQGEWMLPDEWVWTTIGECAEAITGTTPSKKDTSNYGNYLPLVKPPQLNDSVVSEAADNLSEKGAELARVLPPQSVLVSCIGILGKTGINSVPVAFNQQINAIVFPSEIEPRYGFYYMQSAGTKSWLHREASATTVTIVNKSKFQRTPFPLAPLPEQRRIVAEIETQFTRLDAGVAALERARANLRRYKVSVLKAACAGRLVPTEAELARAEGRVYEPADQLLARILAKRRAKWEAEHPGKKYKEPAPPDTEGLPELPEGWAWVAVEQIGEVQLGRQRSPKYHQGPNMRPYLRAANATWNGVDLSDVKEMDFPPEIWGNYRLQKDDILLAEASGSPNEVGKPFIWKEQIAECGFQNTLIRVQLFDLAPDFVHIHFLADATTGRFGTVAKGVNIQHLGANRLSRFAIALPPLAEQCCIVAEVERRLSVVGALEASVEAALARARRLRQAVLKRAFEGRLVPQDPDDEPASVLLERIRAQWETGKKAEKTNRKKKQLRQLELL